MSSTSTDIKTSIEIQLEPIVQGLVSVSVPPVLLGVLAQHQCCRWFEDFGQLSESLFQGRRLPSLPFPKADSSEANEMA